jgi:hypothetical protein
MSSDSLPKLIYVGGDTSYWSLLSAKFNEVYDSLAFEFLNLNKETPSEIQKLISIIRLQKPKVVFVDFSQNTAEMLHIVRVLSRLNRVHKPLVVGLVDLNQGIVPSQRAILAGATCVHIKSVELSSVVYNAMSYAFPDKVVPHGFATAKLNDDILGRLPCMVGLLSQDGIRIESHLDLSIGESYPLHTVWSDKKILRTPLAECASSTTEDLYYNYKFAQEFAFHFVEPLLLDDTMTEEEIDLAEQEREQLYEEAVGLLSKWIENNIDMSHPKALKTLVIDKELQFYNGEVLTDEFPFVLRCQPYLKNISKDLTRVFPKLIIFNFEDITTEELEANEDIAYTFNDIRTLKHIMKTIRSMNAFNPYIIVFNSKSHSTQDLKTLFNYDNIISYADPMTTELVLKMSKMLESKLLETVVEYDDDTLFLKKDHPATYAELEVEITICALSENDIYFNSPLDFPNKAVIRIQTPVDMYVSIADAPTNSDVKSKYYAVLHTIGEVERSDLRKFINTVFFRKHEEKKAKEKEDVEAHKQKALEKKKEDERNALELAEQEKARELEKEKEAEKAKQEPEKKKDS